MKLYINSNHGFMASYGNGSKEKVNVKEVECKATIEKMIIRKGFFTTYAEALNQYNRVENSVTLFYIRKDTIINLNNLSTAFDYKISRGNFYAEVVDNLLKDGFFKDVESLKKYYINMFTGILKHFDSYQNDLINLANKHAQNGLTIALDSSIDCDCYDGCGCPSTAFIEATYNHNGFKFTKSLEIV